jgi:DNA-cytosine methyltransferase
MQHLAILHKQQYGNEEPKGLLTRATGRFYTHDILSNHMVAAILKLDCFPHLKTLRLVEPFSGDGRLVCFLIEQASRHAQWKDRNWQVEIWDYDNAALKEAKRNILEAAVRAQIEVQVTAIQGDTFTHAPSYFGKFHICITNPPWDVLKPDRRELERLSDNDTAEYIRLLKLQDQTLAELYPLSMPIRRFSGWGTNLSRCGVEAALRLTMPGGVCAFVSPASLLADEMSERLRQWVFNNHAVHDIAYYSAEARLFENVDQPSITLIASPGEKNGTAPVLTAYDKARQTKSVKMSRRDWHGLEKNGFVFPLKFDLGLIQAQSKWGDFPKFSDLEGTAAHDLWAGRELDETGHQSFLGKSGDFLFVKGRMVKRFGMAEMPSQFIQKGGPRIPASAAYHRIAWRDVSRPSQKRRMHATIIPPGWVSGNSLSVGYFRDDDLERLKALLAVMNSLVFEAQVRGRLATAHVSLSTVRQARIPDLSDRKMIRQLAQLVDKLIAGEEANSPVLEVLVAQLYGLSHDEFGLLLSSYEKLTQEEIDTLLSSREWENPLKPAQRTCVIPNHFSPNLSDLDLTIVRSVPPGGNWKNVPESVPSQRLKQIRESFAAGQGSRSTYYGRLRADAPSYTINTYFGRPGNGCHIHYDPNQDRVLSQREAARLQSFPDNFIFKGGQGAIAQQIGNAVPPLLGYQIARSLPYKGQFIDLFSGAGGLALGFIWAGWESIVANDIDRAALETYKANIHEAVIIGDIKKQDVFEAIVERCKKARKGKSKTPLVVLGGPPCQGFSTAGNRRSMDDERNWLFRQYKAILEAIKPTGFIFENVSGLLNMEGGRVFEMIRGELASLTKSLSVWKLQTENYGIPQRRTRIILFGDSKSQQTHLPPEPVTQLGTETTLFGSLSPAITVSEALSDLPPLTPGEDGSHKDYFHQSAHPYQELMRSKITPEKYLKALKNLPLR